MREAISDIGSRDMVILLGGTPIVILPIVYVTTRLLSVRFGNVIFGLTIVTCFGWILLDFNDPDRYRVRERQSMLSRGSDLDDNVGTASHEQLKRMTKVLVVLTGQVVAGWGILFAVSVS